MNGNASNAEPDEAAHQCDLQGMEDRRVEETDKLLKALNERQPQLQELLEEMSSRRCYEVPVYWFYRHSFYVYGLQDSTLKIVSALRGLAPHLKLNGDFEQVIADGTGKTFEVSHNEAWGKHTRPIVEAFLHARYMLEMAVCYGNQPETPPLGSGWAAFLCLYNLR